MTPSDIAKLLTRELENKRVYNAINDTICNQCDAPILESDEFYFMGEKEKVCQGCFRDMIEYLESI